MRQGHFLSTDCIDSLRAKHGSLDPADIWIIASHDCDIPQPESTEPVIEVYPCAVVEKVDQYGQARHPRLLRISATLQNKNVILELSATKRIAVPKLDIVSFSPSNSIVTSDEEVQFFQRWMAARYRRSSFANQFESCLFDALDGKFLKKLNSLIAKYSQAVRTLLFRVSNEECEDVRENPYLLDIIVLYSIRLECDDADTQGHSCAREIESLFESAFLSNDLWSGIEIGFCNAISDHALTVAEQDTFKQWRLDYAKLSSAPDDALPPDES